MCLIESHDDVGISACSGYLGMEARGYVRDFILGFYLHLPCFLIHIVALFEAIGQRMLTMSVPMMCHRRKVNRVLLRNLTACVQS